jgi:hypothetical protein
MLKFTLLPEGPLTTRRIMGHMAILAGLMVLIAMAALLANKIPGLDIDETFTRWDREARTKRIDAALVTCMDSAACLGGFVVYRFKPVIARIETCEQQWCRSERAMDLSQLQSRPVILDYNEINNIVLPGDKQWPQTAIRYAAQFTVQQKEP